MSSVLYAPPKGSSYGAMSSVLYAPPILFWCTRWSSGWSTIGHPLRDSICCTKGSSDGFYHRTRLLFITTIIRLETIEQWPPYVSDYPWGSVGTVSTRRKTTTYSHNCTSFWHNSKTICTCNNTVVQSYRLIDILGKATGNNQYCFQIDWVPTGIPDFAAAELETDPDLNSFVTLL